MILRSSRLLLLLLLVTIGFSQESYIDSTKIKDPKLAWKLGVVPGLGQVYNERWIKAAAVMGTQYYAVSKFIEYRDADRIGKRNTYAWWIVGIFIYGMLDAYVDAQLSTFPVKVEPADPQDLETDIIKPKDQDD